MARIGTEKRTAFLRVRTERRLNEIANICGNNGIHFVIELAPDKPEIAEWRRALQEEGDGEFLDPTLAQNIAPKLMDEVERLHAEMARARRQLAAEEAAALEKRLTDVSTYGGECRTCHNAEARAAFGAAQEDRGSVGVSTFLRAGRRPRPCTPCPTTPVAPKP